MSSSYQMSSTSERSQLETRESHGKRFTFSKDSEAMVFSQEIFISFGQNKTVTLSIEYSRFLSQKPLS